MLRGIWALSIAIPLVIATASGAAAVDWPPGFRPVTTPPGTPWKPGTSEGCKVVYVPTLTPSLAYRVTHFRRMPPAEKNYFFYYPQENEVVSFIDPTVARMWGKDSIGDLDYGHVLGFAYQGGFPPGFEILGRDTIVGTPANPPGDNFTIIVTSQWPFIRRSNTTYNIRNYCTVNDSCICAKA
jgi:hypothetical protein